MNTTTVVRLPGGFAEDDDDYGVPVSSDPLFLSRCNAAQHHQQVRSLSPYEEPFMVTDGEGGPGATSHAPRVSVTTEDEGGSGDEPTAYNFAVGSSDNHPAVGGPIPNNNSFRAKDTNPHDLISRPVVVESYCDDIYSEHMGPEPLDWSSQYRYGFPSLSGREAAKQEAMWWMGYKKHIELAAAEWDFLLTRVDSYPPTPKSSRLGVKFGVPPRLRPVVWPQFSGLREKITENAGYVRYVLELQQNSFNANGEIVTNVRHTSHGDTHFEAIEKDLTRTFPEHPFFKPPGDGVARMRSVLRAICWRNPQIGYCQSFNYWCALLTILLRDEEAVFWHMAHLLEDVFPNDYYSHVLLGVKVDQDVICELIPDFVPRLHQHFQEHQVDIRAAVPGWIMALFVTLFPIETTLRVWDALFLDPDAITIPIRVILALLKMYTDDLLRCEGSSEVMMLLNQEASMLFDANKLMKTVSSVKLSPSYLRRLRYKHRRELTKPRITATPTVRTTMHSNASTNFGNITNTIGGSSSYHALEGGPNSPNQSQHTASLNRHASVGSGDVLVAPGLAGAVALREPEGEMLEMEATLSASPTSPTRAASWRQLKKLI